MEKNTYLLKNLTQSHPFETATPTGGNFRGANGIAQYAQLQRKAQKKWRDRRSNGEGKFLDLGYSRKFGMIASAKINKTLVRGQAIDCTGY
jgi:hypothetical protein